VVAHRLVEDRRLTLPGAGDSGSRLQVALSLYAGRRERFVDFAADLAGSPTAPQQLPRPTTPQPYVSPLAGSSHIVYLSLRLDRRAGFRLTVTYVRGCSSALRCNKFGASRSASAIGHSLHQWNGCHEQSPRSHLDSTV
jgi:hypothetical protein